MTISPPVQISDLTMPLASCRPNRIAALAGLASVLLHVGLWQTLQTAAAHQTVEEISQRIEVSLMDDAPNPAPITRVAQPQLPIVAEGAPVSPIAIPLPVADPSTFKPLDKAAKKQPKIQAKKGPPVKRIKIPRSPETEDRANEANPGGSAGGYGVASQTGQGVPGSIGFGGGVGGGSGGGWGKGNPTGTGSGSGKGADDEPLTEANYRANYTTNPKPKYPQTARNRGWEGTVLLKVKVSVEGRSERVSIHKSSGHEILDDSAVAAVEQWRFIPAKRGNTAVACSVIVPIVFELD